MVCYVRDEEVAKDIVHDAVFDFLDESETFGFVLSG